VANPLGRPRLDADVAMENAQQTIYDYSCDHFGDKTEPRGRIERYDELIQEIRETSMTKRAQKRRRK